MEIVVATPRGDADVVVSGSDHLTSLADVIERVTRAPAPPVADIDDRTVPTTTPLAASGLLTGSTVSVRAPARGREAPVGAIPDERLDAVVDLVQIAGVGAGRRRPLAPGVWAVGAGECCAANELERGIVPSPCFELEVDPAGAVTVGVPKSPIDHVAESSPAVGDVARGATRRLALGTSPLSPAAHSPRRSNDPADDSPPTAVTIDGDPVTGRRSWEHEVLVAAGRAFRVERRSRWPDPATVPGHGHAGVVSFNRPPRSALPADPDPLEVPEGGARVRDKRRLPLLALLAPVPIAVTIALVLQRPHFLLFGLLSPVMMLANWLSERRDRKREAVTSSRQDAAAREEFTRSVRRAHLAAVASARSAHPDFGTLTRLASSSAPTLWERRPDSPDAWQIPIGVAPQAWEPELVRPPNSICDADEIIAAAGPLPSVPVVVDLANERGISVVGDRDTSAGIASGALLAACTLHGPADLDIVVCTDPERAATWEWTKWLPHARPAGQVQFLTSREQIHDWVAGVRSAHERPVHQRAERPDHLTLVVTDVSGWWRDRTAPLRPLLADAWLPLRFVVLTDDAHTAPAACTTLIATRTASRGPDGTPSSAGSASRGSGTTAAGQVMVDYRIRRRTVAGALPFSVDPALALETARRLAPLEDADLPLTSGVAIPDRVTLLELLELNDPAPAEILARWATNADPARLAARVGTSEGGPLEIDLVSDGPHGLVAGTTGAGKSELLRSLVAALATALPPDELNVVLIDFKGGSAFDACAHLPHTVGLVTDLDEHLAGRVLRCLRAELHHREVILRGAGVGSLIEYQRLDGMEPLPRLLLVVDEFASLAAELPEFLPSLVDIAQRGRSLGIHMILATQRPAGVVDAKIKANTNLRIALRVQDDSDSHDVIGASDAADIPRRLPGRAIARFGSGDVVAFQSAYSTGVTNTAHESPLTIHPWVVGRRPTGLEHLVMAAHQPPLAAVDGDGPSDLDRLTSAIAAASDHLGQSYQRRPYPEPLPVELPLTELLASTASTARAGGETISANISHAFDLSDPFDRPGAAGGAGTSATPAADRVERGSVPIGLIDLPDEQRQATRWWTPGGDGSMVVVGMPGSGTSSLLAALGLGIADRRSPDDVHLYVIDADTNLLHPLAGLPHCGGVVGLDDLDRIGRIGRMLASEVARRKRLVADLGSPQQVAAAEPVVVVLIDNVGALRQALEASKEHQDVWQGFEHVLRDGQGLGICAVVTAKHERALPGALASQFSQRLVMKLADVQAYASFGFKAADVPRFVPGRALCPEDGTELQMAMPPADLGEAVAAVTGRAVHRPARRVDPLPRSVTLGSILHAARDGHRRITLPVGLDTSDVTPAVVSLDEGAPLLVVGPRRSGRSSMLAVLAVAAARAVPDVVLFALASRGGPLGAEHLGVAFDRPAHPADVAGWVDRILATPGRRFVLVDDADRLNGPSLDKLAASADDLLIAVAGRAETMRGFDHWTKPLRSSRTGILLRPTAADAEMLGVTFGLGRQRFDAGRGFAVNDGEAVPLLAATLGEATDGPQG